MRPFLNIGAKGQVDVHDDKEMLQTRKRLKLGKPESKPQDRRKTTSFQKTGQIRISPGGREKLTPVVSDIKNSQTEDKKVFDHVEHKRSLEVTIISSVRRKKIGTR